MVREDATRWSGGFRDYPKAQAVWRELESKYGLTPVDGRQHGTAEKGVHPTERAAADRAGVSYTAREQLAHVLRSSAVASTSEAEWLRRVRACGVVIKPRFAAGSTDVVAGYRAAIRVGPGPLSFSGGGQVGHDLSLPRIRESWPEPTVEQADAAAAGWQSAFRGQRSWSLTDARRSRWARVPPMLRRATWRRSPAVLAAFPPATGWRGQTQPGTCQARCQRGPSTTR